MRGARCVVWFEGCSDGRALSMKRAKVMGDVFKSCNTLLDDCLGMLGRSILIL